MCRSQSAVPLLLSHPFQTPVWLRQPVPQFASLTFDLALVVERQPPSVTLLWGHTGTAMQQVGRRARRSGPMGWSLVQPFGFMKRCLAKTKALTMHQYGNSTASPRCCACCAA